MSAENGFDLSELDEINQKLLALAHKTFPEETKKFIRRQGGKVRTRLRNAYKAKTKKKTGNLLAGVDGDTYATRTADGWQIRVRNIAPHAHLIEHGHVFYHKGKRTERWVDGKHIAGGVIKEYESVYPQEVDEFVDAVLEKGLK